MAKNSYSIWLMPTGRVSRKLSKLILMLGKRHKSPVFKPHVTLAGGFIGSKKELLSKAKNLSGYIRPFDVRLTSVGHLDEFYRSLFIHVKESSELAKAAETARKLFGLADSKEYMPHLSLIYGHFSKKTKEKIIKEIGKEFNIKFRVNSIYLGFNDERKKRWPVVRKIAVKG